MTPSTTIYYHADCLDGFGAAYAAWRRFGKSACYRPVHYGDVWHEADVAGRDVFVLDFSFVPAELLAIARLARSVSQIDHHASARDAWAGVLQDADPARSTYSDPGTNLNLVFDLDKSGARLAWEYFHPDAAVPAAIAHIEDQDMWRFRLPGTKAFCRALRLREFSFEAWDPVVRASEDGESATYGSMLAEGEAIGRFLSIEVERLAQSGLVQQVRLETAEERGAHSGDARISGLAINASAVFASELGGLLAERAATFGLVWQLAGDGNVKVSLRGCNVVNVSKIAERYGGGGHPNAAGFRLPLASFLSDVLGH